MADGFLARILKAVGASAREGTRDDGADELRRAFLAASGIEPADPQDRINRQAPKTKAGPGHADSVAGSAVHSLLVSPGDRAVRSSVHGAGGRDDAPPPWVLAGLPGQVEVLARSDRRSDQAPLDVDPDPRETAPDTLLHLPSGTNDTIDDFFEGLVRRAEDR